jgi:hypothetical protein
MLVLYRFNAPFKCGQTDGCVDDIDIAHKFMLHFGDICKDTSDTRVQVATVG